MEHVSDKVYEGKLLHDTAYSQRSKKYKEIQIGGIKIDYYDPVKRLIHEVKNSNKMELAHHWQLKYYMLVLENTGIEGITGILEYPKLKKKDELVLSERDKIELEQIEKEILEICSGDKAPELIKSSICKTCAYYDFCYSNECD